MNDPLPTGFDKKKGIGYYWDKPVSALAKVEAEPISEPAAERHRLYSLLTFALINAYFNGNKNGLEGEYPWRTGQRRENGTYMGEGYLGHNIACIAVDENGDVVDFDFNHNEIFNSSVEHAEARLIKRIFALNQIYDNWELWGPAKKAVPYSTTLSGMTVYTSLESCAQCSGIMTLANVMKVVFLQTDPGQHLIGNVLYNLTRPIAPAFKVSFLESRPTPPKRYSAPQPIDASTFGFSYKYELDKAYENYAKAVGDARPFHISPHGKNSSTGITTFLCTDDARNIFSSASKELETIALQHPDFQPARTDGQTDGVKTNAAVLQHIRGFLAHAITSGRRGTPHR